MNNNDPKKIAVIGGSGKAGSFIVKHCIENGYKIKLLLRSPGKFFHPNYWHNPGLIGHWSEYPISLLMKVSIKSMFVLLLV